jgi:hypothetical protein
MHSFTGKATNPLVTKVLQFDLRKAGVKRQADLIRLLSIIPVAAAGTMDSG